MFLKSSFKRQPSDSGGKQSLRERRTARTPHIIRGNNRVKLKKLTWNALRLSTSFLRVSTSTSFSSRVECISVTSWRKEVTSLSSKREVWRKEVASPTLPRADASASRTASTDWIKVEKGREGQEIDLKYPKPHYKSQLNRLYQHPDIFYPSSRLEMKAWLAVEWNLS